MAAVMPTGPEKTFFIDPDLEDEDEDDFVLPVSKKSAVMPQASHSCLGSSQHRPNGSNAQCGGKVKHPSSSLEKVQAGSPPEVSECVSDKGSGSTSEDFQTPKKRKNSGGQKVADVCVVGQTLKRVSAEPSRQVKNRKGPKFSKEKGGSQPPRMDEHSLLRLLTGGALRAEESPSGPEEAPKLAEEPVISDALASAVTDCTRSPKAKKNRTESSEKLDEHSLLRLLTGGALPSNVKTTVSHDASGPCSNSPGDIVPPQAKKNKVDPGEKVAEPVGARRSSRIRVVQERAEAQVQAQAEAAAKEPSQAPKTGGATLSASVTAPKKVAKGSSGKKAKDTGAAVHPFFLPAKESNPAKSTPKAAPAVLPMPEGPKDIKEISPFFLTPEQKRKLNSEEVATNFKKDMERRKEIDAMMSAGKAPHPFLQPRAADAPSNSQRAVGDVQTNWVKASAPYPSQSHVNPPQPEELADCVTTGPVPVLKNHSAVNRPMSQSSQFADDDGVKCGLKVPASNFQHDHLMFDMNGRMKDCNDDGIALLTSTGLQKYADLLFEIHKRETDADSTRKTIIDLLTRNLLRGNKVGGEKLWADKYKPCGHQEVIGSKSGATSLFEWLKARQYHVKEDPALSSSASSVDSDDESMWNTLVVSGPCGSGKSAAVYACAEELGMEVIEIGPSSKRSGKNVLSMVSEATQSHILGNWKAPANLCGGGDAASTKVQTKRKKTGGKGEGAEKRRKKSASTPVAGKGPMAPSEGSAKRVVILFEEAELVFEGDAGFESAVYSLMRTTKCPIILTCNAIPPAFQDLYANYIRFDPTPEADLCMYLSTIALAEGTWVAPADLSMTVNHFRSDIRACLSSLQFWAQGHKGSVVSPHSNSKKCDSQSLVVVEDEPTLKKGKGAKARSTRQDVDESCVIVATTTKPKVSEDPSVKVPLSRVEASSVVPVHGWFTRCIGLDPCGDLHDEGSDSPWRALASGLRSQCDSVERQLVMSQKEASMDMMFHNYVECLCTESVFSSREAEAITEESVKSLGLDAAAAVVSTEKAVGRTLDELWRQADTLSSFDCARPNYLDEEMDLIMSFEKHEEVVKPCVQTMSLSISAKSISQLAPGSQHHFLAQVETERKDNVEHGVAFPFSFANRRYSESVGNRFILPKMRSIVPPPALLVRSNIFQSYYPYVTVIARTEKCRPMPNKRRTSKLIYWTKSLQYTAEDVDIFPVMAQPGESVHQCYVPLQPLVAARDMALSQLRSLTEPSLLATEPTE